MIKFFSSQFIFLLLFFFTGKMFAQSTGCPQITATGSTICVGNCANLTAEVIPYKATTSYSVGAISYSPFAYTGGTPVFVNSDDVWGPVVNLPFNFCFFGNTYNKVVLGANGVLTFDQTKASTGSGYSISTALPSAAQSVMPANSIAICCRDINPNGNGTIKYYTAGTAPCRYLVVYYSTVPLFHGFFDNCNTVPNSTFQLVLYENTNFIDVYIANSTSCTWNSGYGIIGIQNIGATTAVCPAGRNRTAFTAVNEAWRFTPTGTPSYTVSWTGPSGNIGTGLGPINVCPAANTTYTASMSITNCDGAITNYTNTAAVVVDNCGLPVELLNFTATKQTDDVLLKWTTATEINSSHFEVLRSNDGYTFSRIGENIQAAGNSNTTKNYALLDPEPYNGINYYRLKQVDIDGTNEYSNVISVEFDNSSIDALIIPQPALQNAELLFNSKKKSVLNIDVFDLTGRKVTEIVFQAEVGRNIVNLDLNSVSKGIYFLSISENKETLQRLKFLKE